MNNWVTVQKVIWVVPLQKEPKVVLKETPLLRFVLSKPKGIEEFIIWFLVLRIRSQSTLKMMKKAGVVVSNTFRGRTPIRFCCLFYRFCFVHYCLLSLLHDFTSLNQVLNSNFNMHNSIIIFEFDHDAFSQLVELVEQEPYVLFVQVRWKDKSQSILKNRKKKRFYVHNSNHVHIMTRIKLNRGK